jgi:hypothetical protein
LGVWLSKKIGRGLLTGGIYWLVCQQLTLSSFSVGIMTCPKALQRNL